MVAYPRVQTVATFIVCTVVVIGAAVYVYGNPFVSKNTPEVSSITAHVSPTSATDIYIDTADWKETFFNINESDKKNYSTTDAKNLTSENKKNDLTATDLFGREFFSKFMTLRQAGMISNTEATGALVDQIIEDTELITDEAKFSIIEDLFTITDEDNISRQTYANEVAYILKKDRPVDNEVLIAKRALETGDTEKLKEIDPIIATYARVRTELLNVSVPQTASIYHVKLVNGISKALANAVALRNSSADPLQALSAISAYQETVGVVFYAVVDLRNYFNNFDITFDSNEDAYSVFSLK